MEDNDLKLVGYIRQELSRGVNEEDIRKALHDVGWFPSQIDEAFSQVKESNPAAFVDKKPATNDNSQEQTPIVSHDDHIVPNNPSSDTSEEKKRRFSKLALVTLVLFLLIIAAAAVYGYFYYYLAPERIAAESIKKMQTVTGYEYSGSVLMKISGNLFPENEVYSEYAAMSLFIPREFRIRFSGGIDAEDENNIKTDSTIGMDINSEEIAELQVLAMDNLSYMKLNKFTLFPMEEYLDMWLFINMEEIAEEYGVDYEQEEYSDISEEDQNKISESFLTHQPFEIVERLDDEEVNGHDTHHYKYAVNKEQLRSFLEDISDILKKYPQSEDVNLSETNQVMDGLDFNDGEIWIGKEDYYLYRFNGGIITEVPDSEARIEIAFDVDFNNFNQPKNIVAPTEYKTFEEFNQMLIDDFSEVYPSTESSQLDDDVDMEEYEDFLRALRFDSPDVSGTYDER